MKNYSRCILSFLVMAILAIATLVHRLYGSAIAVDMIYHSWWFILLWSVSIGIWVYTFFRHRNRTVPGVLLHIAIIFLFSGALITFFTGETGSLHIRTGTHTVYFIDDKSSDCYVLPFKIRLDHFAVVSDPQTHHPTDYVSRVTILAPHQQIRGTIAVNHPLSYCGYRFLQGSYDEDMQGVTLMVNHDPYGMWLVYGGYLLFLVGGCWRLFFSGRFRACNRSLDKLARLILKAIFVVTVLLIPFLIMICMDLNREVMPPVLLSGWLKPHVWAVTAAYALFFGLSLISIFVEIWHHHGYEEKIRILTVMSRMMLYPAVMLLGAGICLGSVWASQSWGAYWSWDPKEVWALITLLVYVVPAHYDTISWMQNPICFHRYLLFAFFSVALTYWGVNCCLGGMHSYAP